MPPAYAQIDAWMRNHIHAALPDQIVQNSKDRFKLMFTQDQLHIMLFFLFKVFAPGSPEEKSQVREHIGNPRVCSKPKAAQAELGRWKDSVRRCRKLKTAPPMKEHAYAGFESIFKNVFI